MKKTLNLLTLLLIAIFLSLPATLSAVTGKNNSSDTPTKKNNKKKPKESEIKKIAEKIKKLKHTKSGFKNINLAIRLLLISKNLGHVKLTHMLYKKQTRVLDKRTKGFKVLRKNLFENHPVEEAEEINEREEIEIEETWFTEETDNCNPNSQMPDKKDPENDEFDPDTDRDNYSLSFPIES